MVIIADKDDRCESTACMHTHIGFLVVPYSLIVYWLHHRKTSHSVFSAHSYQTDCLLRSTGSPQINKTKSLQPGQQLCEAVLNISMQHAYNNNADI